MATLIAAPVDLVIARSDGIDVKFAGMVLDSNDSGIGPALKIELRAAANERRMELDLHYQQRVSDFASRLAADPGADPGDALIMPGNGVLEPVKAVITDDVGTAYRLWMGRIAGTGTDWDAALYFLPVPPEHAGVLDVEFTLHAQPTGHTCRVRLD